MSPVSFLPERLPGFYGWSVFVRLWIYFSLRMVSICEVVGDKATVNWIGSNSQALCLFTRPLKQKLDRGLKLEFEPDFDL